ncbi:MAG: mechanosensitive ion channel family protein, partial [Akkermansiaceae bacterium]|nr:mechanosensitive ion channel family protein [Akkermansiaceae bacterium]
MTTDDLIKLWKTPDVQHTAWALAIAVAGVPLVVVLAMGARRLFTRPFGPEGATFWAKFVRHLGFLGLGFAILHQFQPNMEFLWADGTVRNVVSAVITGVIGFPLVVLISRTMSRIFTHRFGQEGGALLAKILRYFGFLLVVITILQQFKIDLGAILGAAGIAGVAVGFASQTSLSNLISGLFIVGERPFEKGDVIEVGGLSGIVEEIGLMALTLRTFDNRSVRVPNETLVKTNVVTVTRYPLRRVDTEVGVAYDESIERVMRVLREVADQHPSVLDEPEPVIVFNGFGDSAMKFMIGSWAIKEDYLKVKNEMPIRIKQAFDREGIEMP